ncbi:MAG: hypothetical protein HZA84_04485 [Thaumarchaeota archaeon]|nr:hypothetical protein [Nitrososphaerota archaeon]
MNLKTKLNFSKKQKIRFEVEGKPPQKSQWGTSDAILVINLREAALKARTKAGRDKCFTTPVKLKLIVYAPNIDKRNYVQNGDNDEKRYVGDLDSLVAGVCDYLRPGPKRGENNFERSKLFDDKPEIDTDVALMVEDDSQIVSIVAEKRSGKLHYVIEIEPI